MSEQETVVCDWCGNELDEEEREAPRLTAEKKPICDDCHHKEYEFTCCWCEEYGDNEVQHKILVVFVPTSASYGDKVQPGVYEITGGPYWTSDYFSSWLDKNNLKRMCSLPEDLQEDDPYYPVGHLCEGCQVEMKAFAVLELTKKCARAFC